MPGSCADQHHRAGLRPRKLGGFERDFEGRDDKIGCISALDPVGDQFVADHHRAGRSVRILTDCSHHADRFDSTAMENEAQGRVASRVVGVGVTLGVRRVDTGSPYLHGHFAAAQRRQLILCDLQLVRVAYPVAIILICPFLQWK